MSVIKIENLVRDYGGGKGVFDVSFHVNQGEAFGFLGPNGAGKTTTIRHLMGFLKPQSGKCTIADLDCWNERDKAQARLGYIPGEISFFDDMSGTEFLKFIAEYRKIGTQNRKEELLERFELDPKSKIKRMSKGMKQKLGIVAAFMHDPDIFILDEPTSGLDPLMQNKFINLVAEEKEHGKTILMSSHMFEEVERTCDCIGIIRKGRMVAVDFAAALRERHTRGAGISAFMYVLQMLANVGGNAEKAKYFTFFTLFNPDDIIVGESSAIVGTLMLFAGAIVLYALGIIVFERKDLHI